MTVTTSQQLNGDQLQALLPAGSWFNAVGATLESTGQKTLTMDGAVTDDVTLQAAVDQAAAEFVDYDRNKNAILAQAKTALSNNQAYLAIPTPTQAQAGAQITALTRQVNGLIRFLVGDFTATS